MYGGATKRYMQVNMQTATRGQILLALYEAAIRYAKQGAASIRAGNIIAKSRELQRVSAIVAEFASTLDRPVFPELCDNLERLYFYMQERIAQANATLNPEPAEEVARLLEILYDAWKQAVEQVEGNKPHMSLAVAR